MKTTKLRLTAILPSLAIVAWAQIAFAQSPPNLAIQFVSPTDGAHFSSPATVTLMADLSDTNAVVSRVEFYANGTKLGEDADTPFVLVWTNITDGTYSLVARAFVANLEAASSSPIAIVVEPAPIAPSVGTEPSDQQVPVGGAANFSVVVNGTPPLAYQWFFNQTALAGETRASLKLVTVQTNHAGDYFVVISNDLASVTSRVARLTISGRIADKQWEFGTGGPIRSSPAIAADGTIYVGSADTKLYALNSDGTQKWAFTAADVVNSSPAIGADGTIYFGAGDFSAGDLTTPGTFYALRADGAKLWEFVTPLGIASSPALANDGSIYFGCYDSKLYALRPDGTKQWEFAASDAIYASPVVAANREIVFGSFDGKLRSLKPDGTERWSFATGASIQSSPAIGSDGTIYFGSSDKKFYALNPDGSKQWEFATGNVIASSPAIGLDGTIYFGCSDARLYAVNPDGTRKWDFKAGSLIFSSPAIGADGVIYFGSNDKKLYAVGTDGVERWQFATGSGILASPVVASNGIVYFGSFDAKLYAVQGVGGLAASQWPMFRRDPAHTANLSLPNQPPNVAVTSPTNAAPFVAPATVLFKVNATDADGQVTRVEFFLDNSKLGEATNAPFEISITNLSTGTYTLSATATDELGAHSASPSLSIIVTDPVFPPVINVQPLSQSVIPGATVNFTVTASGTPPLAYQWQLNGNSLTGATNATLRLTAVTANDAGVYSVIVSNVASSVTSLNAQLTFRTVATNGWTFVAGGGIRSSPVIAVDGTVYFGANDNKVYALNYDGTKRWEFDTGDVVEASPTIGTDGTIYVGSWSDKLYALAPDGTKLWEFTTGDDVVGSAATGLDGTVYFGSVDHNLYALNANGTERWRFAAGGGIYSSPALGADGTVFFGANDNKLHALAPDGSQRWEFATGGVIDSSPALGSDGAIFFGSHDKNLYALNADGSLRWSFSTGGEIISSPAIGADGAVYFGSYDKKLYCLEANGAKRWEFPASDAIYASPLLSADGAVYFGALDNRFYTLNSNGTRRAFINLGVGVESSAAMGADGTIVFGASDGQLRALPTTNSLAVAPWPMFRGNAQHSGQGAATPTPPTGTLTFLMPQLSGDNTLELTLVGPPNANVALSASTNLLEWSTLTNFASADGTNRFHEPLVRSLPRRFYRAQSH